MYCEKCGAFSASRIKCMACHARFADKCVVVGVVIGTIITYVWGV